ncbi:4-hydroxy-tetrahydrodipicolinate reductase [uncultured Ferrovibrio sp.]|jgi:4-hydroxy-tetrahydrodipicolinate reductase|uniref:4-hydroxy-tetrahydrodipicolinate reductase n=1 Tax=uncultured Ferrovibrio sp. TaxID=1576913 RepID=UPI00262DDC04|nr:4-hydroxy-tetrahydrodipicolinate reductase [uncultured Ferrovibrio sp.]
MSAVRIGIVGIGGRMGQALAREVSNTAGAELAGGTERAGSPHIGKDVGALIGIGETGIKVTDDAAKLFANIDAVIDFTVPEALPHHAALAAQCRAAYIVGTTGLAPEHFEALKKASHHCAIVQGYNMSLGVNLMAGLVRQVAAALDESWDIEIVEMHHRMKVDAPSGTAILFGEAAAAGRGVPLEKVADRGRDGITGARKPGNIGFAALRGGNVVGEHTVIFAADHERIELSHKATDRGLFARGAVRAAIWAKGKQPGLYRMADVLGFGGL